MNLEPGLSDGRLRDNLDFRNPSSGRSLATPSNGRFDGSAIAFKSGFDATVRQIADPAADAQLLGAVPRGHAKPDTLNGAANENAIADVRIGHRPSSVAVNSFTLLPNQGRCQPPEVSQGRAIASGEGAIAPRLFAIAAPNPGAVRQGIP